MPRSQDLYCEVQRVRLFSRQSDAQVKAQVKDGVLVQDVTDTRHFWLIAEWRDIEEHARIRKVLADVLKPEFVSMIEGRGFIPAYGEIVSATLHHILNRQD